jgi:hypothetical protein
MAVPKLIGKMMRITGKTSKVLVLTNEHDDGHTKPLLSALEELHCPWIRLDPVMFPTQVSLSASLGKGQGWQTTLCLPDGSHVSLEEIRSVWYRRPTSYTADAALPAMERDFIIQEAQYGMGGLLRGIPRWVNHPEANRTASYKPLQLQVAQAYGFSVPKTLITNDPDAFRQFYEECHGQVVYKLLGPPIFWDGDIPVSTYTQLVPPSMLEQATRITKTAHLFQAYVDKSFEVRVTVIGEAIFAAAIYSQDSDYTRVDFRKRYADLRYAVHELPDTICSKILKLMEHFGLVYGALDLIVTPEGEYQFLEVNASGQFGWIEAATDLPLFHTLACHLAKE